jgi:hypothetical protein
MFEFGEIEFAMEPIFKSLFHLLYQAEWTIEEKANCLCEEMRISVSVNLNPQKKERICFCKLLSTLISHKTTFPAQTRDAYERNRCVRYCAG